MYRTAIDLGQNAVKLVLKTLILVKGEAPPRSHGGCIHKFGELYLVKGEVEREIITRVYRVLKLRNKAGYDPNHEPTKAEVNEALQVCKEIREIVYKILK
jgi:uncharacterized protein (UPF0332 family)